MENKPTENPQIKFTWQAPLRPYIKRSSEVIRFYIAVTLIFSIIVVLLSDPIILIPMWALFFIFYVFTVTPPPEVTNKITQFGVDAAGMTYRWEYLSYFYFIERFGYIMLVVVSHAPENHHAYMVVPDEKTKTELVKLLSEHIVYQERPVRTLTDRLIEWFSKLVPHEEGVTPKSASQTQTPASP